MIDEDDQEENEMWKVYCETEVSGRLCAQYLNNILPLILKQKNVKTKTEKNEEL